MKSDLLLAMKMKKCIACNNAFCEKFLPVAGV